MRCFGGHKDAEIDSLLPHRLLEERRPAPRELMSLLQAVISGPPAWLSAATLTHGVTRMPM